MASSTASRRLFLEYKNLTSNPPDGITAGPVSEDDIFLWEALIQGPDGTPFEGGIFPAELKFPKDYPLNPPTMRFLGEVWHPNGNYSLFFSPANPTITSPTSTYIIIKPLRSLTPTHSHSLRQRPRLHLHPPRSRRRSAPLRKSEREMESDPERGENPNLGNEHASGAE